MKTNIPRIFFMNIFLASALIWGVMTAPSPAPAAQSAPNNAAAGHTGQKAEKPKRIGLIVGGPYTEYQLIFRGMIEKLAELGLVANDAVNMPEDDDGIGPMWQWLAANAGGDEISFVADAFYSPNWNQQDRSRVIKALRDRLNTRADLDCVLAFGTWGGQDAAAEDLNVPVLVDLDGVPESFPRHMRQFVCIISLAVGSRRITCE
ncbi:MAG: hypothetical protein LBD82_01590, partial [Deltaproteobacteria bacterium]|nr:hypothetical protein [Deltaproteobacteria bacterium]